MFCPRCGHEQVSDDTRFCSRCGLPLGLVADLVVGGDDQLRRERRELAGVALMTAAVLMLTNFIIVFGAVTLPHLANSVFLWVWLSFAVSSAVVGGLGVANLIRSGFFKRLKGREARLQLMKAGRGRQTLLPAGAKRAGLGAEAMPRLAGPASVTETTTRELAALPVADEREIT